MNWRIAVETSPARPSERPDDQFVVDPAGDVDIVRSVRPKRLITGVYIKLCAAYPTYHQR